MAKRNKVIDKYEEYHVAPIKCRTRSCKTMLNTKNEKDVGYCLDCYNEMMADDEDEDFDSLPERDIDTER